MGAGSSAATPADIRRALTLLALATLLVGLLLAAALAAISA